MTCPETLRLLIVEDRAVDAELALRELRRAGMDCQSRRVETAADLERELRDFRPHAVLTDYRLPCMDGFEALDLVRRHDLHLPVLFLSGTLGEERAIEALRRGASDFVVKDRPGRLPAALLRALQEHEERRRRAAAEGELHALEERLRLVAEASHDVIWDWSVPEETVWRNETGLARFGYSLEEVEPTVAWWRERIHPEEREGAVRSMDEAVRLGERSWHREYRFRRGDGTFAYVVDRCCILYGPGGRASRLVGTVMDVSQLRNLQAQLLQAQKMEAIGRLAGGVAHDFNNLLTVIGGSAELLMDRLGPDRAELWPDLQEIRLAAEHAAALTSQLLAFSRRQVNRPTRLRLDQVIERASAMIGRLIGEDIELRTELDPAVPTVEADENRIKQILLNLAVNARDAMTGGGRLSLRCRPARDGAELEVEDTGAGIDEHAMRHLFEPFFTTKPHGTGLGLATVEGLVRALGGRIEVDSRVGEGTTFRLWLPPAAGPGDGGEGEAPAPTERPGPQAGTVLVVEDEDVVRGLVLRILRAEGFEVLEARDGLEAMEVCLRRASDIDIVLTDTVMPRMGGVRLREELLAAGLRLPILAMSGYLDVESPAATDLPYLQKPFTPKQLAEKVRQVLDQARTRR